MPKKPKKPKETESQRKERLALSKTMTTKVVPDKAIYNRKKKYINVIEGEDDVSID